MHEQEQYITLTEAAKLTPGRPSTNCIWRWCRKGVLARIGQRIRLQHMRIGGTIYTTAAWLEEFGKAVAAADAQYFDANQPPSGPRRRHSLTLEEQRQQQEIEHARAVLDAAGI